MLATGESMDPEDALGLLVYMKENKVELPPHTLYKAELSCIKDLNIRVEGVNLWNLGSASGLIAVTPKAQAITEKKQTDGTA